MDKKCYVTLDFEDFSHDFSCNIILIA